MSVMRQPNCQPLKALAFPLQSLQYQLEQELAEQSNVQIISCAYKQYQTIARRATLCATRSMPCLRYIGKDSVAKGPDPLQNRHLGYF